MPATSPLSRPLLQLGEAHSTVSDLRVPALPSLFAGTFTFEKGRQVGAESAASETVKRVFPLTYGGPIVHVAPNKSAVKIGRKLNVGVVLAGRPTPSCEYLFTGVFSYLSAWNSGSKLFAFLNGPNGLVSGDAVEVTEKMLVEMQAQKGVSPVGVGTNKIQTQDFEKVKAACEKYDLDGLVFAGGYRNNTDAAHLAEYFKATNSKTSVVVVAKRAEGVRDRGLTLGLGFDSLTKTLAWLVGNVAVDASSAQSSWHFIRLVGRSSEVTLEVALQTHPHVVIIAEEAAAKGWTFTEDLVNSVCDVISARAAEGKNYGVVVLPEGIVQGTKDLRILISELNDHIAAGISKKDLAASLSPETASIFARLPPWVQEMLLGERDAFGHIDLTYVSVERFLAHLCERELKRRKDSGLYFGKFGYQCHFYGNEGRCAHPSKFDASLACALGFTATALIEAGYTSYFATVSKLAGPLESWQPDGVPITSAMMKDRHGNPVVRHSEVRLEGYAFKALEAMRKAWALDDLVIGPVGTLSDEVNATLLLEELQSRHTSAGAAVASHEKEAEFVLAVRELLIETSTFNKERRALRPVLPVALRGAFRLVAEREHKLEPGLDGIFPSVKNIPSVLFQSNNDGPVNLGQQLTIGIVLSGGPAPGGHNVIAGLFDYLKQHNPHSKLLGFVNGPSGLVGGNCREVTPALLDPYRNQGGFHMIGTSRTKIEKPEQFQACKDNAERFGLNGIVVVGGDDSNTNAALLADYFVREGVKCKVVGVPKTIDADLRNQEVEMSFGFDTTTKVYSQLLANIALEAETSKEQYQFVRLMGRSASHITLECTLQTHVNYSVVSEEVAEKGLTMNSIVSEIVDLVCKRAALGKNYGVIVIPEGLIEFTADMKILIAQLNEVLAKGVSHDTIVDHLTPDAKITFNTLPDWLRSQLLADRDPHGNVRVSAIESERMVAALVKAELEKRPEYTSRFTFSYWCHFLGYQGRCNLPSQFDSNYCYTLGYMAGALVESGQTAVIAAIRGLTFPVDHWELRGVPLASMMTIERRKGHDNPVIRKKLVDIDGPVMKYWKEHAAEWAVADSFPGYKLEAVTSNEVNLTVTLSKSF